MDRFLHRQRTYLETALNRRPEQLAGIIRRKAENALLPRLPIDVDARYERRIPTELSCYHAPFATNATRLRETLDDHRRTANRKATQAAADGTVTFLSTTYHFPNLNWHERPLEREPLLWWLKLQGFEHFAWPVLGYDDPDDGTPNLLAGFESWFRSWKREHAIADEPGYLRRDWIPHSVSLRILNWCRFLGWAGESLDAEFRHALVHQVAKNAAFLADHIEYDLDGNHLVENAVALVAAGILTGTDQWCEQGLSVFERAARTQFLDDGGHFERSPMYHIQVLTRFLTAIDLLELTGREVPGSIRTAASDGLTYLAQLQPPDNRIPLLHDSVYGETLSLPNCLAYGDKIGINGADTKRADALPESGYFWLGDGDDALLSVGGQIAVPHLPAHAHVHPGHVSLYLGGEPVLTDTGTYSYGAGSHRLNARSIAGHNTVQVDGQEPVAIADSFLMGDPVVPSARTHNGEVRAVVTRYKSAFGPRYTHRRDVFHADTWWLVWDQISASGSVPISARYQCHPSVSVRQREDTGGKCPTAATACMSLERDETDIGSLTHIGIDAVTVETGEYFPEFGVAESRQVVRAHRRNDDRHAFGCLLLPEGMTASVTTEDERPVRVQVSNRTYELP